MNSFPRVRRPLVPVALACLFGVLAGLFLGPAPLPWTGLCLGAAVLGWWGPQKLRTPAIWIFWIGVFALYTAARTLAPEPDSLRGRAGDRGGTAILQGWIMELPSERTWEGGRKVLETEMAVKSIRGESGWEPCEGRVLLRIQPPPRSIPRVGDRVEAAGYLTLPAPPGNPGEFNRRTWMRSRGLDYQFRVGAGEFRVLGSEHGVGLARLAGLLRAHMIRATSAGLESDPEAAGLIAAMLFGYRDGVGEDLRADFQNTGTLHLFAVSGQNLAMVAGVLLWVLALTGAVRWRWAWITLPAVFLFCLATGMEASAQRAFVMISVLYAGWVLGRSMDPATWLSAALMALLIWDPAQLLDPGFQLSFLVVAGLMIGSTPIQKQLVAWGRPDPWIPARLLGTWRSSWSRVWGVLAMAIAASTAAWLGSLIPGVLMFHQLVPVALVANLVAAPLAGVITLLAATSSLIAVGSMAAATIVNLINARLVHFLAALLGGMATWPGSHLAVGDWQSFFLREPWIRIAAVEGSAPSLVSGRGGSWLIDPGSRRAWPYTVKPFLQWHGLQSLQGVILTAGVSDRMGAALELMASLPVAWWAETGTSVRSPALKAWRAELERRGEGKQFWRQGDIFELGRDWRMHVLWPPAEGGSGRSEEDGLVLLLESGRARMLWAGSISGDVEQELIWEYGSDLRAGVLVQGPSRDGAANLTRDWLDTVEPEFLVRWGRTLEDDGSLSVDFADQAWSGDLDLWKLKETGSILLQPQKETGRWKLEGWRKERP